MTLLDASNGLQPPAQGRPAYPSGASETFSYEAPAQPRVHGESGLGLQEHDGPWPCARLWLCAGLLLAAALGWCRLEAATEGDPDAPSASQPYWEGDGVAELTKPNVEEEAAVDAMRKAIREMAGVEVEDYARTSFNSLVAQYTYTKAAGFVERAEPRGAPRRESGFFFQRYRIWVKKADLNCDLVANKVDVKILYDAVQRPRLCLAIVDEWKPRAAAAAPWEPRGSQFSENRLMDFFKKKHRDFIFKDLTLLRDSAASEADFVREAKRNSFDVLIVGKTRSALRKREKPEEVNPWALRKDEPLSGGERFLFDSSLEWRVLNVATEEMLLVLNGEYLAKEGERAEALYAPTAACDWSCDQLLNQQLPVLFRDLLAYWNAAAFENRFELVFHNRGTLGVDEVDRRLKTIVGLEPGDLRLEGVSNGNLSFSARTSRSRAQLLASLLQAFNDDFRIDGFRPGKIELTALGPPAGLTMAVANCTLTQSETLETALENLDGVTGVDTQSFAGGVATFRVFTNMTARELGTLAERAISGLQVTDLNNTALQASMRDVR